MNTHKSITIAAALALGLLALLALSIGVAGAQDGYDPGYDVAPPWGEINVADIQAVAGHWNTTGVYTSGHTHWGETWTGSGFGLFLNGGATLPILRTYNSSSGAGVSGRSAGGNGVYGQSDVQDPTKAALYGYSSEHASGVYGESTHGYGIYGNGGDEPGDYGGYFVGHGGVRGMGEVEPGGYFTSTSGYGVYGWSDTNIAGWFESGTNHGVYGKSTATEKAGVTGYNVGSGGWGVYGFGSGRGVYGYSSGGYGGYFESTTGTALHVEGDAQISGNLNGGTPWTSANDGPGSGLAADTLDGQHANAFASATHNHDDRYYTESEADTRFVNDNSNEVDDADIADGALSPAKIAGTAWTSNNDGPGSGLNADWLDGQHASAFAAAGHDHWGETWSGSNIGLSLQGSSATDASFVADNAGGGPAIRVGQGGLSSQEYSYVWAPGSLAHLMSGGGMSYTDIGGVSVTGPPWNTNISIDIPIALPSVLYGREVRIEQLRVNYQGYEFLDNACIVDTYMYVQTSGGAKNQILWHGTDRCSSTWASYDVAVGSTLYDYQGPVWVRLVIQVEDPYSVAVGGVRLQLSHN